MSTIEKNLELTFSGCGFLGIYHLGVVDCLKKGIPNLTERIDKVYGCSAGCLVGMMLLCDKQMSDCLKIIKDVVVELKDLWGGPLNFKVKFSDALRKNLDSMLPDNAHEIATDRLFISCTQYLHANQIISKFDSKEELITVMIASCYVPGYGGFEFPEYRGNYYYDGGLSNNLPRGTKSTISVAPFCGDIDICPEPDKYAFTKLTLSGHTLEISLSNIWRIVTALFPMSSEKLDELFKEGKRDCQKFLDSHPGVAQTGIVSEPCVCPAEISSEETGYYPIIWQGFQYFTNSNMSLIEKLQAWKDWSAIQLWEALHHPRERVLSGLTSYLSGKVTQSFGMIRSFTSTTTKTT